ncbi:MAG: hypothetical protein H6R18_2071 [Proteobacteria bacterium]|nr:hypothetical protein [Pseudomonadota bacterium]
MKRTILIFGATIMAAGNLYAADCAKSLPGNWEFDLGGGVAASVEYKANGTFIQKIPSMKIEVNGTYSATGNSFKSTVDGKSKEFTITKCDAKSMTTKRTEDGKTMEYKRK